MRAPLIMAWAKPDANNKMQQRLPIVSNAVNTQVATILDILPTVLSVASVEKPMLL